MWPHRRYFKQSTLKCNYVRKHEHSNLEVLEAQPGLPGKYGWKMQGQYHFLYLVKWRRLQIKPCWKGSMGLQPCFLPVRMSPRDSLQATSLSSFLSTQFAFLIHSQLFQSHLQTRIMVILIRYYPAKTEAFRGGPLFLASQVPLLSLGLQVTRTTYFF